MRTTQHVLATMIYVAAALPIAAQTPTAGPWDIAVDVGAGMTAPSVTPAKPVARIGDDDYLAIQILVDNKVPPNDHARLRFAQRVLYVSDPTADLMRKAIHTLTGKSATQDQFTELGASHLVRFRKCSVSYLSQFQIDGHAVTKDDCPLLVSNGEGNVTVYANSDSVALDAEVDTATGAQSTPFAPQNTKHALFTIRTVRPWWNLNFSTGFSFFSGDHLRDEQYRFAPVVDDPATAVDESKTTDREIVSTGHGETPYELGAFATYMIHRPANLPVGVTFGVSSKIPVDQLTALAGLSARIEPFPVVNSAYITVGVAYRGHKVLMPKYRDTLRAPAGVSETDILVARHDVGLVIAVSFGFGGGEAQFKKVVSGGQ